MIKKRFFIWFLLLWSYFWVNADLVYPIQEMSKVECRFQKFSTLSAECKMQLPILKTSDYTKYKNDYSLYRRVYTILWGSSYNYGWDVWNGWHQWVDIASAEWTPVYSIYEWKVVQAGSLAGRWNTVKIEHTINGRKVYSNYSHMSKIDVSVGQSVQAKTKVWEVWNTGNSTGNHLHFQIDLAVSGKWPWYRSSCSEKNYDTIVNTNVCFWQLNTNTIDPLVFLETNGAVVQATTIDKPTTQVISQQWMLSREEILKIEIADFLKSYNVQVKILNTGANIELGKKGSFRITVIDKRTRKPFTGSFPGDMNFKYDNKRLDIFPTGILQIDNGSRDFTITPKVAGKSSIDIYIGETFFKKLNFWVFDTSKQIIPKQAVYSASTNNVISETKKWVFYFKDNFGLNILWVNFNGRYTLKSNNNSIKFCIKKVSAIWDLNRVFNTSCRDEQFRDQIEFTAQDAILWIVVFNYKVTSQWSNSLIIENSQWQAISTKALNGTLPVDLQILHPYYNDILLISKLWLATWINKGYFLPDRDLTREDGVWFLRNYLEYQYKACFDTECKSLYTQNLLNLNKEINDKYSYFTREEYLQLLWKYIPLSEYRWSDYTVFRDLEWVSLEYSKNILKASTWNDYFGQTRYFQPTKVITRWEAAFLLNRLLQ